MYARRTEDGKAKVGNERLGRGGVKEAARLRGPGPDDDLAGPLWAAACPAAIGCPPPAVCLGRGALGAGVVKRLRCKTGRDGVDGLSGC